MKKLLPVMIVLALLMPLCVCMAEDTALFPARGDNGLWGYIDRFGAFVIEPRYERESPWMGRYAAVSEDGRLWGIVNARGGWVMPPEYVITWETGGRAMAVFDADPPDIRADHAVEDGVQVCGLFDLQTGAFTGFRWKSADLHWFDTPMIPVLGDNGLWGCLDLDTGEQIPCRFVKIREFNEGWAVAQLPPADGENEGICVLVSKTGDIVYPPEGLQIKWWSRVGEGLITVWDPGTQSTGYMDVSGKMVIPPHWYRGYPFEENFAVVEDHEGYYRYIDREDNVLPGINARPEDNGDYGFVNGLTSVFVHDPDSGDTRPGAMNDRGEIVFTLEGKNVCWLWNFMDNGLAWYMEWHPEAGEYWYEYPFYGLVDSEGNKVTDSVFVCIEDEGSPFCEGLAAVFPADDSRALRGYIDETGNWAIAPKYAGAYSFSGGLAYVKTTDGRCGYIDHNGAEVYLWQTEDGLAIWDDGLPE